MSHSRNKKTQLYHMQWEQISSDMPDFHNVNYTGKLTISKDLFTYCYLQLYYSKVSEPLTVSTLHESL